MTIHRGIQYQEGYVRGSVMVGGCVVVWRAQGWRADVQPWAK